MFCKSCFLLTTTIISSEPVAALTVVSIRIVEMHHTCSSVLARRSVAHVWTSECRPQSIHEVGVGCTHPSRTLFWKGLPILVIAVNYFCICPTVTKVLNGKVFVVHVAREVRTFDYCRFWI